MTKYKRGRNPRSKENLKQGAIAKSKGAIVTNLTLTLQAREVLKKIGDNNMSEGVEKMTKFFDSRLCPVCGNQFDNCEYFKKLES